VSRRGAPLNEAQVRRIGRMAETSDKSVFNFLPLEGEDLTLSIAKRGRASPIGAAPGAAAPAAKASKDGARWRR